MNKLNGKVVSVIRGDPYATYEVLLSTGLTIAGIGARTDDKSSYQPGDAVGIYFDEMDVILAKYFSEDTTIRKRFTAIVDSVEQGKLLLVSCSTTRGSRLPLPSEHHRGTPWDSMWEARRCG